MCKRFLALMLALVMVVTFLPGTAFAAETAITDFAGLQQAIKDAKGTKGSPTVIKVSGEIICTAGFTIGSGQHIKLVGEGTGATLKRSDAGGFMFFALINSTTGDDPDCSLTLENVTIDGNNGTGYLIRVENGGDVTIGTGAVLTNNAITVIEASAKRGYTTTCTIDGGVICNNHIDDYNESPVIHLICGGTYGDESTGKLNFYMKDGEIKDNTSHYAPICDHGGGDSTVTISGGKIYNNKVTGTDNIQGCGGAIYSNRKVVITGGEIYNNTAEKFGGAIYMPMGADTHIDGGTSLTITGGTITGNTCESGVGDGIYVLTHNGFGGNFIVGDDAKIEGVYLPDSSYMLIESKLTGQIELECQNPSRYTPNTLVARPYGSYAITQNDISKLEYKGGEYGIDFKMNSTTDVVLTAPFCNIYYELTNLTATEDSATRGNDSLTDEF